MPLCTPRWAKPTICRRIERSEIVARGCQSPLRQIHRMQRLPLSLAGSTPHPGVILTGSLIGR